MSDLQPDGSLSEDLNLTESRDGPEVAGGETSSIPKWMAQLADRYKTDERLAKFQNFTELVEDWDNTRGRLAELEGAENDELPKYAPVLDVPESPEGYKLELPPRPEFMAGPEYKGYTKDLQAYLESSAEEIKGMAHELGLPNAAAQRVAEFFTQKQYATVQAAIEDQVEQRNKGIDALKRDWKGNFSPNVEMCRRTIKEYDDGSLVADLEAEGGLANKPSLLKFVYRVSKDMGEDILVPGTTIGRELSPAAAKQQSLRERYDKSPEMFEGR